MTARGYDQPTESALLGAVLQSPDKYAVAIEAGVTATSFVGPDSLVWHGIEACADTGIDPITVGTWMVAHHGGEWPKRISALHAALDFTSANAHIYAATLVELEHNRYVANQLTECLNGSFPSWRSKIDALCATADGWYAQTDDTFFSDWEAVMAGEQVGDPPSIGLRDDHVCAMLYAGKINNIIGESESGKSMIVQWWSVQEAQAGNHVIYLDFEDAAPGVGDRFAEMGATAEDMSRIFYRRVDEPWTSATLATLRAAVVMRHPTLCVVDGVTNAMALEGLDPLDNKGVASFYGGVPSLLRSSGGATAMVDHIVKARQDRAPGALGAQHKRAGIDGASLMLRMKQPAGRNRVGTGFLTIDKDRPGFLREYASDGKTLADVTIRSDGESIVVELAPSSAAPVTQGATGARRTGYMERVSQVLEGFGEVGASTRTLNASVKGRDEWIREGAVALVAEGYVRVERVGAANRYVSIKAYRETMESPRVDDRYEVDYDDEG